MLSLSACELSAAPIAVKHWFVACAAAKFGGSAAGVSLGCLLGMAPLLFLDGHKGENGKPPSEQS